MERQRSVVALTGGVGSLSFYKTQDGYQYTKKPAVNADRIHSDHAFERTRENMPELRVQVRAQN
jgi:hypothetical protein